MSRNPQLIRRRRVPRREFNRRIGLLVRGRYHLSRATQIGEGGMMLYCEDKLKVGQEIVVSFRLPGRNPDVVRAVVRYVIDAKLGLGERYGIEFIELDFAIRRAIRNYVATQANQEIEGDDASSARGRLS